MIYFLVLFIAFFFFFAGYNKGFSAEDLIGDIFLLLPAFFVNTLYAAIFLRAGIIGALTLDYHGAARVSAAFIYGYALSLAFLAVKDLFVSRNR